MPRWIVVARCLLILGGSIGLLACATQHNPTAPDLAGAGGGPAIGAELTAEQVVAPPEANVTLRGLVRQLNPDRGVFIVVPPSGGRDKARWVKVEPRTVIWTFNGTARTRLRLASLKDGMLVEIRGVDRDRFVVALTIAVRPRE